MSKRQCPFEYNLLPQMKVRMDQKKYDSEHKSNMAKIHDKTLRMLFNGAKKHISKHVNNIKVDSASSTAPLSSHTVQNISEFCKNCNDLNVIECQCSFCDKWMCGSCIAICFECHELFCTAHFLKVYQSNDAECVCLNCADHNSLSYKQ